MAIAFFILGLLLGYMAFSNNFTVNVDARNALKAAESDIRIKDFIQNSSNSKDIGRHISLIWDQKKDIYYWKVVFLERKCGCSGPDKLNIAEVIISPITGTVLSLQLRYGIDEDQQVKEECMIACHEH